ncbi:MAG TPA: hypothetical protein VFE05_19325 [Longimicrobiaceae bacterium]|nr:hypothetical protein [Longimicrobiaceae bacterium]
MEFAVWSNALMEDFRSRRMVPVMSDLLAAEITLAPATVRAIHAELRAIGELVGLTPETSELLSAYESHGILSPKYHSDMSHIALATVCGADAVASWNFKHLVRFDKIRLFNAVNLEQGYKPIAIHSPREVATYGGERD